MFKTQKVQFFILWFVIVSTCIYLGTMLVAPFTDFLRSLNHMPYSLSNDGFSEGIISILLLIGLFMGFGQWLAINTKIRGANRWVLATVLGFGIGSFVSFCIFAFTSILAGKYHKVYEWIWMIGTGAGAGIFTGISQWLSLKRKLADAIKWACVMALSLAMGIVLFLLVGPLSSEASTIIFSIAVGSISGAFAEPLIIRPETQQQEIAI